MRIAISLVAMTLVSLTCPAETLRELLLASHIPVTSFSDSELTGNVNGTTSSRAQITLVVYRALSGEMLSGPVQLVRYDKSSGHVYRRKLQESQEDVCAGSVGDPNFIGEFTLLSTSISPSAECLLVLGKRLELVRTLYGFSPVEVAPETVVLTENMIHFAPVHPERLQIADLRHGTTQELYPPKADALRAQLAREHAKHMPADETCMRMNDPCDPEMFDEDISALQTDGKGRFSFIANQSASHSTEEGKSPDIVASQVVLYVYARSEKGWLYCEQRLPGSDEQPNVSFDDAVTRCTPGLPVVPDGSTAVYNPFLKPQPRK